MRRIILSLREPMAMLSAVRRRKIMLVFYLPTLKNGRWRSIECDLQASRPCRRLAHIGIDVAGPLKIPTDIGSSCSKPHGTAPKRPLSDSRKSGCAASPDRLRSRTHAKELPRQINLITVFSACVPTSHRRRRRQNDRLSLKAR
jgi:hypothetical protein